MGGETSKLKENGYKTSTEADNYIIATKGDEPFFIKKICLTGKLTDFYYIKNNLPRHTAATLSSVITILKGINHPHIVNMKNSFEDEKFHYVVMDYCQGGNLADEITKPEFLEEAKVLSWITEICVALKAIHEATLHHKKLMPKNILFTECGIVRIAGSGNLFENSRSPSNAISNATINYLAPEVFTKGTYDAKSDIWSVGCIFVELCTKKQAFSAETTDKLIRKITSGASPLPIVFSQDLTDLLNELLKKKPEERPTASEILARPIIINCLSNKSKTTVKELDTKLTQLRNLADGLESFHERTTIGSLSGGVIGAAGGITCIVGLILAPFTLGASLIVTGVGIGVGVLGGITAGASNIANMVNQSSDRKAIHSLIKEFEQKINAVVIWLLEISNSLQTISNQFPQTHDMDSNFTDEKLKSLGFRAGKGLCGITELIRLVRVMNIGKIAAQASRAVRAVEVATGVLSGLFVAVDIFFIAIDAKEIHHIKQAKEAGRKSTKQDQSASEETRIRSEIMKFVLSVREAANKLEDELKELKTAISYIPSFHEEDDLEWQSMELM